MRALYQYWNDDDDDHDDDDDDNDDNADDDADDDDDDDDEPLWDHPFAIIEVGSAHPNNHQQSQ